VSTGAAIRLLPSNSALKKYLFLFNWLRFGPVAGRGRLAAADEWRVLHQGYMPTKVEQTGV